MIGGTGPNGSAGGRGRGTSSVDAIVTAVSLMSASHEVCSLHRR
jgi:hypothetical protein